MADRKISERQSNKSVVRTGGKVFSDGSILELIRVNLAFSSARENPRKRRSSSCGVAKPSPRCV
jgi:hypothetical protein